MQLLKYLLWLAWAWCVEGVYCPPYCRCHMLHNLRYVSCVGKGLISVYLDIPSSAQWIQLSNNSITSLSDNVFMDVRLVHLVKMELNFNTIGTVGRHAFEGLSLLESVELAGNNLYLVHPETFVSNGRLRLLDLSRNPLDAPALISQSLQALSLSSCHLGFIHESLFEGLPSLKYLNLSENQLISLDSYSLRPLHNLAFLDISRNKLICNRNRYELLEWLKERNIKYTGLQCGERTDEKSQKMISLLVPEEGFEDIPEEEKYRETCSCEPVERDTGPPPCVPPSPRGRRSHVWATVFLCGAAAGSLLGCSTLAAFCALRRCRAKRHVTWRRSGLPCDGCTELQDLGAPPTSYRPGVPPPDTPTAPPPSYQQLFPS